MPNTVAERKLRTIERITRLEDEAMLLVIEQLLFAKAGADWVRILKAARRLDDSILPNALTGDELRAVLKSLPLLSLAADATHFVTGDKPLLEKQELGGIQIITWNAFSEINGS